MFSQILSWDSTAPRKRNKITITGISDICTCILTSVLRKKKFLQVRICSFSVLSFCSTDQEFLQWPTGFSSYNAFQGSHWLFQSLLCWRWWSWNPCLYLFIVHDGERCKLPAYHNTLGSFSFSRSNLSLSALWFADSFQTKWKVIISKSWSLPVSAPGKLCVLALFTPDWKRFLTRM